MASVESVISRRASAAIQAALAGVEQGGVEAGMPRQSARDYARQSLLGSALLLKDLADSPAELKDLVASPGGTTIAGLAALEDSGVRGVLIRAMEQAVDRSAEGGRG